MFTRSKGQGIIIEILLFSLSVFLAITTFIILASEDTVYENEAEAEIERQIDFIHEKSVLDIVLDDMLWKAPEISQSEYGNLSAIRVTSYYFSTNENIDINGNSHPRTKVRDDLSHYYSHTLDENFGNDNPDFDEGQDYLLNISKDNDYIEVENQEQREGRWSRMDRPLYLSNGETAEITFWIKSN